MARTAPQPPPIRDDGLQIDERRSFQERFWTAERWAWGIFALVLFLALAGLLGGGGYFARSSATLGTARLDYPPISRWQSPDEITITLMEGRSVHRVEFHDPFSRYFQIEDVQPQPERSALGANAQIMEFPAEQGGPARITIHLLTLRPGLAHFMISVDGTSAEIATVILP